MLRITPMPAGPGGAEYLIAGAGCSRQREETSPESYYLKGATDREPLGWWIGSGLPDLDLEAGGIVTEDEVRALFGELCAPGPFLEITRRAEEMIEDLGLDGRAAFEARETALEDARDASRLGAPPRKYRSAESRAEDKIKRTEASRGVALEPEERDAILTAARSDTRQARGYYDLTYSPQKSVSLLHAGLLVAGREDEAAEVVAAHRAGVAAAMAYLEKTAGLTRTGYHGKSDSKYAFTPAAGKWVEAPGWISAEFMHYTSREGEPQLHSHVALLNRTKVLDDFGREVWRTVDGAAVYAARAAAGAVYERVMEQQLEERLPVVFDMREDGKAREIRGIGAEVRDPFSTRRAQVVAARDKYTEEFVRKFGREPSAYELTKISEMASLMTRKDKEAALSVPEMIERYKFLAQERLETTLPEVVETAFELGAVAKATRILSGPEPVDQGQVIRTALEVVQTDRSTFRRTDLIQALNRALPDGWTPGQVYEDAESCDAALEYLATMALSGLYGTVQVAGHQLIAAPAELRRADGRSVYQGASIEADWYSTVGHMDVEGRIVARAQAIGAPALTKAAAHQAGTEHGLSDDQLKAAVGALTDGRSVSSIVGPGGTGKTRAQLAIAAAWKAQTGRNVIGLAPSNVAAYVLAAEAKLSTSTNTAQFVANLDRIATGGRVNEALRARYGDLIILDEAGMASTEHMSKIIAYAARVGAKVLLAGDHFQLGSPEAGGMFRHLVENGIGVYQLDTVRRFRDANGKIRKWEAAASLRLRVGDWRVLSDYKAHGRIHSGTREEMIAGIADRYVADAIEKRDGAVMCSTNEAAAEVSAAIRTRMVRLHRVEEAGAPLLDGNIAGVGDRIQTRENEYTLKDSAGMPVYNRFVYEVTGREQDGSLSVRRITGRDEATSDVTYAGEVTLPADYVQRHVVLGYAGTGNAVQGVTVTGAGHELVDGSTNREGHYVAMTRSTSENHAWVQTVSEADTQEAHGHDETEGSETTESDPLSVLAGAMRREGAQLSATATQRVSMEHARSGTALLPQWTMTVADWHRARVDAELIGVMGVEHFERLREEGPASVYARIRETELRGHDVSAVLRAAVTMREMETADSMPALLTWRIEQALVNREPERPPADDWVSRIPAGLGGELGAFMLDTAGAIEARRAELGERLAADPPEWAMERIGPVPAAEAVEERADWQWRAGTVELYRETYRSEDAISVLGPVPGRGAVEQRIAWRDAAAMLEDSAEDVAIRTAETEQLYAIVREAAEVSRSAPEHVAEDLEKFIQTRDHYNAKAQITAVEQETTGYTSMEELDRADVRLKAYQDLAELTDQYAAEYVQKHNERTEWYAATAAVRERAAAARAEIEDRGLDPDAVPEPVPVVEIESLTPEQPALFELDEPSVVFEADAGDEYELSAEGEQPEQHQEHELAQAEPELIIEPTFRPELYGMEQPGLFELDAIEQHQEREEVIEEAAEQVEELTRTVAEHVDQIKRQKAAAAKDAETAEVVDHSPGQTIEEIMEAPGIGHAGPEIVLGIDGPGIGM